MDEVEYRLTHPYRVEWRMESKKRLTTSQRNFLFSIILKKRAIRLVDPYIANILKSLWEMQIPTMGLTKLYTGNFGVIEDFTQWRLNELKAINIDFTRSAPLQDEMLVEGIEVGGGIPTMKGGVILTANVDKGQILSSILRKKNYYPKQIIFVDDLLENLEAVGTICADLRINFQGFEYKGASLIPEIELDRQSEKIRFEILEAEHRWLTDLKL
ncbi:DUF2608 domain-containing protein [Candidatus Tisiphia endosymbiont of Nemotelus uliginosus]|uniref:DUF2608 domain-containing protein n=1 Tax=Candidatus Tisiphia endosymbiont of Nemotelus uliginosus TaxID=3077926 RepID=UPI0035C8D416